MKKTFTIDTDVIKDNIRTKSEAAKARAYQVKIEKLKKKSEKKQMKLYNKLEKNLQEAGYSCVEARNISTNIINESSQNTTTF